MKFTDKYPITWKDLQDQVALLLNQAGYMATSPCTIETVRGKVEVDVLVESPDELVKKIICECKYWKKPIPQEKVHAFQTVVHNSGASLGLMISQEGFQSGAIEAAKLSNVKLLAWAEFINLIADKWIISMLKRIKRDSVPLSVYSDYLDFPYEKLNDSDKKRYMELIHTHSELRTSCWMIRKTDLLKEGVERQKWYKINEFSSIESYLNFLYAKVCEAVKEYEALVDSAHIEIPLEKFEKLEGYTYMFLN